MADETRNTEISFLEEKKGPKLHVKDILFIVLRNLHWLILCGAVGAVIGILLAPQSGEETREMISENAKVAYQKAQNTVKEIQDKADDAVETMQKKGEEIIGKIQDMIDQRKEA